MDYQEKGPAIIIRASRITNQLCGELTPKSAGLKSYMRAVSEKIIHLTCLANKTDNTEAKKKALATPPVSEVIKVVGDDRDWLGANIDQSSMC